MTRPLLKERVETLEVTFTTRMEDADFLRILVEELEYRSTNRAVRLKARAERALAEIEEPASNPIAVSTEPQPAEELTLTAEEPNAVVEEHPAQEPQHQAQGREPRYPPLTNEPPAVLSAWSALEVLSPPAFRRETDLTGGDRSAIAKLDAREMPWQRPGGGRPNYKLYYQVVLGTIKLDEAVAALVAKYGDTRPERQGTRGEAVLASIMLDRHGRPIEEPAVTIASFGWGVPKALTGDLATLGQWQAAEKP